MPSIFIINFNNKAKSNIIKERTYQKIRPIYPIVSHKQILAVTINNSAQKYNNTQNISVELLKKLIKFNKIIKIKIIINLFILIKNKIKTYSVYDCNRIEIIYYLGN